MADDRLQSALPATDCWASRQTQSPGATHEITTEDLTKAGKPSAHRGEMIAKVGTVVSAIVASSCCWLPPLLILFGVSGAGMVAALEEYRPAFMVVTFGFLAAAFYFTYRPRRAVSVAAENCCAPSPNRRRFNMMAMNKVMLWAVTGLAVVFLFFPQLVTGLFASSGELTADMQQTVIRVEGMTCPGWELKAETAIQTAPGVLAVKADYETGQATIGTEAGTDVPIDEILAALDSIGYSGKIADEKRGAPNMPWQQPTSPQWFAMYFGREFYRIRPLSYVI